MSNGEFLTSDTVCAIDLMPGDRLPEGLTTDDEPNMHPLTVTDVHHDEDRTTIIAVDSEGDAWHRVFKGEGQYDLILVGP